MRTLTVTNWDRWQSYRADRGQPPWIKVHRTVLRNPEWTMLTDAQRGQLVQLWILAADKAGVIEVPDSVNMLTFIQRVCCMESAPSLQVFESLGFISMGGIQPGGGDANVTPTRRQGDANVTTAMSAQSRVVQSREEKSTTTAILRRALDAGPRTEDRTTTAQTPAASEPTPNGTGVLTYPCRGEGHPAWELTQGQLDTWAQLYPGADVLGECRKALAWISANANRRKTANGMPRCLVGWLNRAGTQPGVAPRVEPRACTCGDAYRNSYRGRCVECNGSTSAAQRDALQEKEIRVNNSSARINPVKSTA